MPKLLQKKTKKWPKSPHFTVIYYEHSQCEASTSIDCQLQYLNIYNSIIYIFNSLIIYIYIYWIYVARSRLTWKYRIACFLSIFKLNLFAENQVCICFSMNWFSFKIWQCWLNRNKLVSSANNFSLLFGTATAISFTYIKNSNGPNTEPCGTPHEILPKHDEILCITVYCFLFER